MLPFPKTRFKKSSELQNALPAIPNVQYREFLSLAIGVIPIENKLQCRSSRLVLDSKLLCTMNSIKSVSFKNFKCFSTEAKIELRPLTLFYGYNNSGKSALLRGVCMAVNSLLKNGSEPLDRRLPVFSSDMMLDEIVTQETGELQQGRLELRVQLTPSMQRLSWEFYSLPERQTYVVSHFTVEASDGTTELGAEWLTNETPDGWIGNTYQATFRNTQRQISFTFSGLLPNSDDPEIAAFVESIRPAGSHPCHWLHSERSTGKRDFRKEPVRVAFSPSGEGFANLLRHSERTMAHSKLFQDVALWFRTNLHQELYIKDGTRDFEIQFGTTATPTRVNLCDVGQGLQETLPLLTALLAFRIEPEISQLAFEEPESHLHPKYHAALANAFCTVVRDRGPKLMVETHSQNLLLGVQTEIARQALSPEDVVVYWVRSDIAGNSVAEQVTFDGLGQPSANWPPDVFSDDVKQSRALYELRKRQQ